MAREHARVKLSIWDDDDFRALSPAAQHLYFVLLTSSKLDYCGVTDWRPARIAQLAGSWTAEGVEIAAQELCEHLYLIIDTKAEEVLLRSFIRNDGLMEQPNLAVAMKKAHTAVASTSLRRIVVHELVRLHTDKPELKGWARVRDLLDRSALDPSKHPTFQASVTASVDPKPTGSSKGSGTGPSTTATSPSTSPAPAPPTGKTEGNNLVGVRNETLQAVPAATDEACTHHGMNRQPGCRGCQRGEERTVRRIQGEVEQERRDANARAIACTRCDGVNVTDPETKAPTRRKCDHRPAA